MRKLALLIPLLVLCAFPAHATTYYVDCQVGSSGNGLAWATAWKGFSNITGLAAGDTVYFSGSGTCSTYSATQWTPTNGTLVSYIHYQVGQDAGHNSAVTFSLSGSPGIISSGGTFQGIWIDGNFGGARNLTISGDIGSSSDAFNGLHISYVNTSSAIGGNTIQNFELDHNMFTRTAGADHVFTSSASAGDIGYTNNLIHDNIVQLTQVNDGSGHGTDGFQWIENVSFYNNTVYSVFNATPNGQHLDFIQTSGDYVAIYNNYFENAGNYPNYGDFFGNVSHWRIFNNVYTEYTGHGSNISQQAMGLGFDGVSGFTMDDFTIVNNTCYAQDNVQLCVRINQGTAGNKATNTKVENNIAYNIGFDLNPGTGGSITFSNNTSGGTSGLAFVSTAAYPSGNWHITSGATAAIGQALNLTSLSIPALDVDAAGIARPSSGAWDIGAYQFAAGQNTVAPATNLFSFVAAIPNHGRSQPKP